jgi:hypothetical protein
MRLAGGREIETGFSIQTLATRTMGEGCRELARSIPVKDNAC